jgi:hypothetical protein
MVLVIAIVPVVRADYTVTFKENQAHVEISAKLAQNITIGIPRFSLKFLGGNTSLLSPSNFNDSIRSLSPNASVHDLEETISSDGSSIRIVLAFRVEGVSQVQPGVMAIDTAWRSFAVRNDIVVNGTTVNLVGNKYFLTPLQQLASQTTGGAPIATTFLNGDQLRAIVVENATQNFALLDFSYFNKPLENWERNFDAGSVTTSWQTAGGFNVTVLSTFREPAGEFRFSKAIIWYVTNAKIVVPGIARPSGDKVLVDTGGFPSFIMTAVIVGSSGIFLATLLIERRMKGGSIRRTSKDRKNKS